MEEEPERHIDKKLSRKMNRNIKTGCPGLAMLSNRLIQVKPGREIIFLCAHQRQFSASFLAYGMIAWRVVMTNKNEIKYKFQAV